MNHANPPLGIQKVRLSLKFCQSSARVRTQSDPESQGSDETKSGKEILRELVVSCCNSPEIREPAEAALDDISLLVSFLVMVDFLFAI